MATVTVKFDDKRLRRNLRTFDARLRNAVDTVVDYDAAWATGQLKMRAPWTDRTGAARTGLTAIPHHGRNFAEIIMSYSVYYGIWLEVANDRKYAVITPMVRILGDKLMKDLQHLIDRMGST
jgi:hypothetical protein